MAGKKRKPEPESETFEEVGEQEATSLARRERDRNLVLYLDDSAEGGPVIVALVVPDLSRCQCEWPDQSIVTFGPKPIIRCDNEPTVVAFQKRDPDSGDDSTGAISLCDEHKVLIEHMYPGQCYFRRITQDRKIGDFA